MHKKATDMYRAETERLLRRVLALLDSDTVLCPNLMVVLAMQLQAVEVTIDQVVMAAEHMDGSMFSNN
jgi:hypothetical protein